MFEVLSLLDRQISEIAETENDQRELKMKNKQEMNHWSNDELSISNCQFLMCYQNTLSYRWSCNSAVFVDSVYPVDVDVDVVRAKAKAKSDNSQLLSYVNGLTNK